MNARAWRALIAVEVAMVVVVAIVYASRAGEVIYQPPIECEAVALETQNPHSLVVTGRAVRACYPSEPAAQ